jgi:hypothetical protein
MTPHGTRSLMEKPNWNSVSGKPLMDFVIPAGDIEAGMRRW